VHNSQSRIIRLFVSSDSVQLTQRLDAEIISVDSRQIYRQMDIGTVKPTPEEQQAARYHLIDCVDISRPFSVADYQSLADTAIADIQNRDRRVLLVGGAGLYFFTSVLNSA
jgi:tRNA dimethylallyltransferase